MLEDLESLLKDNSRTEPSEEEEEEETLEDSQDESVSWADEMGYDGSNESSDDTMILVS